MKPQIRLDEIDARRAEIKAEVDALSALEAPTDEDGARAVTLADEFAELEAERTKVAEQVAKIDAVRTAALNPENVTPAFHAPEVVVKRDAFENIEGVARGYVPAAEVTARALTAVEEIKARSFTDAQRERATELIEGNASIARHILLTGSEAYRTAFETLMRHPEQGMFMLDDEQRAAVRAALSNTAANGGYTVPFLLDPTVILTNDGATNPIRGLATVVTGTSDDWNGVTSAGVTAEWLGEGSEAADASPTVGTVNIPAIKASAYVFSSYEQEADGQLVSQLPRLIADAKDRLEAAAFATGAGSTSAPEGVVTGVTAITASRITPTTGGTFTSASIADVYKVANAIPPRAAGNASWIANKAIVNIVRQQASAQTSGEGIFNDFALGLPSKLLGAPVYEASSMTATVTTGSNILLAGDFKAGYVIYDRVGVEMRYLPVVTGSNGRPTGQAGWFSFWRVGAKVVSPEMFRVLKL